tara:strand:+ start:363 stop:782 length:420 start_codon:yes stop_codon:yes gene_type:complete
MKLQYEILSIGLKESMMTLINQSNTNLEDTEYHSKSPYFKFSTYFVNDKQNLMDIMIHLGNLSDDEERIKEELLLLLSFFILTFEHRGSQIKKIIIRNSALFVTVMEDFNAKTDDEETKNLINALTSKLNNIEKCVKLS